MGEVKEVVEVQLVRGDEVKEYVKHQNRMYGRGLTPVAEFAKRFDEDKNCNIIVVAWHHFLNTAAASPCQGYFYIEDSPQVPDGSITLVNILDEME